MYARSAVPAPAANLATPKQVEFIQNLLDTRDLFASPRWFDAVNAMDAGEYVQHLKHVKDSARSLTRKQASDWITRLLTLPHAKAPKMGANDTQPDVPAGRYALEFPEDELNPVRFYKINHGKKGSKWEGFIFVDRFVSDELFPVKGSDRLKVLDAIAADPLVAAQRFGHEEKCCCKCGRRLTRRLSRHLAIGPICGERNGWFDGDFVAIARQELRDQGFDPDEVVAD